MQFPDEAIAESAFFWKQILENRSLKLETTHLSSIKCNNAKCISMSSDITRILAEFGFAILLKDNTDTTTCSNN